MTTTTCRDCEKRPATVFLPEGRYLCSPCWKTLKAFRIAVISDMERRRSR